jgi:CRP-like cAMP-binding protein
MMLKATSVFNTLPDEVLADIAANLQESVVPSGQPIVMEGDIGRDLYIIARGQVQLSSGGRVLAELGEHGIFGDLATLIATPQPASVIALSDTSLLQLSQNQLTALMEEHTTLAHAIMRTLAHHLRECLQELNQLGLQRNISAIDAPVAMSNLR